MKFSCPIALLATLLLTAPLPACLSRPSDKQQAEAAEKTVLTRHDELMARMDQLYELRQQLQPAASPDTAVTGRRRRSLLAAAAAMMSWMHQYHRPSDSVAAPQRLAYFKEQQQFIDSVGHLMETSIDSARLLLRPISNPSQP